jgi:hypothetical protein
LPTSKVDVAVKVIAFPGETRESLAAREIPSQVRLTWFDVSAEPEAGIGAPRGVMNAANVWRPEVAA